MLYFDFSERVIEKTIQEIREAEEFIRIAIFQLHNNQIFDVLDEKLKKGIKVEIITLPYDSIHKDVQKRVESRFEALIKAGALVHFCKWNVGDPERTTTATGRWYSFHGKFIVTDKSAISLSANFIDQIELDTMLVYKNDVEKISEYNEKFNELLELFIKPDGEFSGNIHNRIINTGIPEIKYIFKQPSTIQTDIHIDHWITDYPSVLCPSSVDLVNDNLLICPFDIRGRDIFTKLVEEAERFIYISTESFTDLDFANTLIKKALILPDIQILTGATSMDFSDRMQIMLRNLIASGISVYTTNKDLHAKLLITDKHIAVSSINLNKMNLGFKKRASLWRENTETISTCSDPQTIASAKQQFEVAFKDSINISTKMAEKIEGNVKTLFTDFYNLRSNNEVKSLFSKFILFQEINVKQITLKITGITAKLMQKFSRNLVTKDDFMMALILYYLSERKQDPDQLNDKLKMLDTSFDIQDLLSQLESIKLIERENSSYKLCINSLFS